MVDMEPVEDSKIWDNIAGDDATAWCLLGVDGDEMVVKHSGAGGLDEMKKHLKPDSMLFGGFRVDGVDKRGGVTSRRCKLVAFSFAGESVKPMVRAQGRQHMSQVLKYFHGHHLKLDITDPDDLTEDAVVGSLRSAGGAHQPQFFEFGSAGRLGGDVAAAASEAAAKAEADGGAGSPGLIN
eukprot:CAMPEP_0203832602 /NCGR_PEP_ID=MMETSP0115-20131106/71177_1 /ASSEMBLY_ACC=CAM_ASM_000227 /TAXON_ID=33651 /ORGANISM="Bicosoecid sp, Strain ms1" /LENGTH=180 /DNA_ID=CAMNT_0050741671 /DNA_START=58 /DNA_END=597 /DNA_ORIENTATION=+